ncbi:hypothetical protein AB3329_02085 [Streptococcus sp. H31]|uniref:hypothetical protein n=1 Tax=Streptococcus huangxiaojuni TaxID=3237239 RepID=UPI0034A1756A
MKPNYVIKENEIVNTQTKSMTKVVHDWNSDDNSWGVTVMNNDRARLHEFSDARDFYIMCCCCANGGTGSLS